MPEGLGFFGEAKIIGFFFFCRWKLLSLRDRALRFSGWQRRVDNRQLK